LEAAAREAKARGFDQFTTTLLESTHQNHTLIKEMGQRIAGEIGIPFYYEDFRKGVKTGIQISRLWGCTANNIAVAYTSEKERFFEPIRRNKRKD